MGIHAEIRLTGVLCADGKRVRRVWGLFGSDCHPWNFVFTTVEMRCPTTFGRDGSIHIRYLATVKPTLLPIVRRHIAIDLVVRPDGHIVRFP